MQLQVGKLYSYPRSIIAQVVALERLHATDTRCDSYTLFLSDGMASEEYELSSRAQAVSLEPSLNHLIETRQIKLYSIIQMDQYTVHEQYADIGPLQSLIAPKT